MTPTRPPPRRGRHVAAPRRAAAFLSAVLAPDAAAVAAAFVRAAIHDGGAGVDMAAVARAAGLGGDDAAADARLLLVQAGRAGLHLVEGGSGSGEERATPTAALREAVRAPGRHVPGGAGAPLDPATMAWIPVLRAAVDRGATGEGGLHVALRIGEADHPRLVADLAAHLAASGARVWTVPVGADAAMAVLRAELHAGARPRVVVMPRHRLCDPPDREPPATDWGEPATDPGELPMSAGAAFLLPALSAVRDVYVWPIPADGRVPTEVARVVGAVVGPVTVDPLWAERSIAALLPGAGGDAVRGLLASRGGDPRDAGPALRAVRAAVAAGFEERAACALVAGPVAAAERDEARPPPGFDPHLLVCGEEAAVLLRDAPEAFAQGGRLLAHGPPGGGKTSLAQALAARLGEGSPDVAGRPTVVLTPSRVLARAWGATERLLKDLWGRADREGAVILADEWGSLCGVRECGAVSGGNAYLTRALTDEMLREMDAHPRVPLLATVNDVASVDPASLRRFTFVLAIGDRLSPGQERLAWRLVLKLDPPPGWRPRGAAVADYATAAARCRALGRTDAQAHAHALAEAAAARRPAAGAPADALLN